MPAENTHLAVTALNVYPLKVGLPSRCQACVRAYQTVTTAPARSGGLCQRCRSCRDVAACLCKRQRSSLQVSISTVTGSSLQSTVADSRVSGVIPGEHVVASQTPQIIRCALFHHKLQATLAVLRLALIEVSLPPQAFTEEPQSLPEDAVLSLRAPGQSELRVLPTSLQEASLLLPPQLRAPDIHAIA